MINDAARDRHVFLAPEGKIHDKYGKTITGDIDVLSNPPRKNGGQSFGNLCKKGTCMLNLKYKKTNRIKRCLLIFTLFLCLTACAKRVGKTSLQESQSLDIMGESLTESESQTALETTLAVTESSLEETIKSIDTSDYILPESDSRFYTREELGKLSDEDLRFARNEIFARHGRTFMDNELQLYFASKSWYTPQYTPEAFEQKGDAIFNEFEQANRNLIVSMEQQGSSADIFSDLIFYGDRVFAINSYIVEGDTITLTGDICDSGFAAAEYLMSLKPGDEIEDYGTVIEVFPDGHIRTQMTDPDVNNPDAENPETVTYYLSSDRMSGSWSIGGEGEVHRLVKENVTLIYDLETKFIPVSEMEPYNKSFLQLLLDKHYGEEEFWGWRVHLKQTTNTHIDIVEDLVCNYVG